MEAVGIKDLPFIFLRQRLVGSWDLERSAHGCEGEGEGVPWQGQKWGCTG